MDLFIPILKQQWQAVLRWLIAQAGAYLVAKGVVDVATVNTIVGYLTTAGGALLAVAPLLWSVWSNSAKVIHQTSEELKASGK